MGWPKGRPRPDQRGFKDPDRLKLMVAQYERGMTLLAIGETHNLTRERVRQILRKHLRQHR